MAVYQSWEFRLLPDYLSATPRMLPLSTQSKRAHPSHPHFSLQDKRERIGYLLSHVRPFVTLLTIVCQAPRPWNSTRKNAEVGCHSLLQGFFPTQGSNLGLLHCRQILHKCQGSFRERGAMEYKLTSFLEHDLEISLFTSADAPLARI